MVEVGRHGAFSVNGLGLGGAPFPMSFSVGETTGCWSVHATAAQAAELADVLMRAANDTILVVNLATTSFLDEDYVEWRPSRIAEEQGVSCDVHSLGALASGVPNLSEEVLLLRRDELPRFLAGWSPYALTLIDLPERPTPTRLDEIALAVGTANHDEPVLPRLVDSRLFFSGHDDCYVTVESTDRAVPAAIFGRLLALMAGSMLVDASPVDVPDPDGAIPRRLLEDGRHWIGVPRAVTQDSATIDLSAASEPWTLGQRPPERSDHAVVYNATTGMWCPTAVPPRSTER